MATWINCTPHEITVRLEDGSFRSFAPSGIVPRVSTDSVLMGSVDGMEFRNMQYGAVEGLPPMVDGTFIIVSAMVKDRTNRPDIVAPDTGKTAIRNERGQISAVTGFIS